MGRSLFWKCCKMDVGRYRIQIRKEDGIIGARKVVQVIFCLPNLRIDFLIF